MFFLDSPVDQVWVVASEVTASALMKLAGVDEVLHGDDVVAEIAGRRGAVREYMGVCQFGVAGYDTACSLLDAFAGRLMAWKLLTALWVEPHFGRD